MEELESRISIHSVSSRKATVGERTGSPAFVRSRYLFIYLRRRTALYGDEKVRRASTPPRLKCREGRLVLNVFGSHGEITRAPIAVVDGSRGGAADSGRRRPRRGPGRAKLKAAAAGGG
ncbi:hypothetical protein EVAR_63245_1 [Eumeta japonica]|uniref:Uncharacterized protein n=1 Tax=Eumeta variegata TaxID=151549 RepID=A0A4C1ZBW4_EUMVA|nr:hypothetical protein EVAR_63245_1 [Eumeta japonica]